MAELLSAEDLAYMRGTQAEARPTAVLLQRIGKARTAGGEYERVAVGVTEPLQARIWDTPDEIPQQLADRYEGGTLVKLSLDMVLDVRAGDLIQVPPSPQARYELVSEGVPDEWATAQLVWAVRLDRPERTA